MEIKEIERSQVLLSKKSKISRLWQIRKPDNNKLKRKEITKTDMRRVKANSSSCSQIVLVYLQPFCCNSLLKCAPQQKIAKINKTPYFESSRYFKVIDVDTTKKLITSACCDRQHKHAYLQPFSQKADQQQ